MGQRLPFPDPDLGSGLRLEGVALRVSHLLTRPARQGLGVAVGADVQDPGRLGGSVGRVTGVTRPHGIRSGPNGAPLQARV